MGRGRMLLSTDLAVSDLFIQKSSRLAAFSICDGQVLFVMGRTAILAIEALVRNHLE